MSTALRRAITVMVLLLIAATITVVAAGYYLARPAQQRIGPPPADLNAESIAIPQPNGPTIAGWFVPGDPRYGSVLLTHSIRSNRREMIARARFLKAAGYSVLLIDLQAHGETPGDHLGFGYLESRDIDAAVHYLRTRRKGRPIGLIGVSLGGAAALLGPRPADVDALVLESVFSSVEQAMINRLIIRFGAVGGYLAPLLLWQIPALLGISADELTPVAAISQLRAPLLVIHGSIDRHTLIAEAQALYATAPEPKSLWIIDGAAHQDLHQYARQGYQQHVLNFFTSHLAKHRATDNGMPPGPAPADRASSNAAQIDYNPR